MEDFSEEETIEKNKFSKNLEVNAKTFPTT